MKLFVLYENSMYEISGGIFADLKKIYLAHAAGREPDKMVLNRTSEVMVRFLASEIDRTEPWLDPDDSFEPSDIERDAIRKMIDKYIAVRDNLDKAYQTADYKKMWINIDHAINLNHWYGSVWDNLMLASTFNSKTRIYDRDPATKELYNELTAFMRSIGRFPRIPVRGDVSREKRWAEAWKFGPEGDKVPYGK